MNRRRRLIDIPALLPVDDEQARGIRRSTRDGAERRRRWLAVYLGDGANEALLAGRPFWVGRVEVRGAYFDSGNVIHLQYSEQLVTEIFGYGGSAARCDLTECRWSEAPCSHRRWSIDAACNRHGTCLQPLTADPDDSFRTSIGGWGGRYTVHQPLSDDEILAAICRECVVRARWLAERQPCEHGTLSWVCAGCRRQKDAARQQLEETTAEVTRKLRELLDMDKRHRSNIAELRSRPRFAEAAAFLASRNSDSYDARTVANALNIDPATLKALRASGSPAMRGPQGTT
jgi:hypothetical protein